MSNIRNSSSKIESFDAEETEECFIDGDVDIGTPIASFNFGVKPEPVSQPAPISSGTAFTFGTKASKTNARGSTPAVDGECFTIKRCYLYRPSMVRKLNELKANHSDVNMYLSTIIDEAISYYYDYVFNRRTS